MSDNLISLSDRSPEERSEIAKKGGIASGEAKRKKKALRELFSDFLHSEINPTDKDTAESLGINLDFGDNKALLAFASCVSAAISDGNARDLEKILSMAGELEEESNPGGQQQSLIYLPEEDKSDGTENI